MKYPRARNLQRIRVKAALTQRELGKMADVHPNAICRLESQDKGVRGSTLRRLAEALDCTPGDILGDVDTIRLESESA